MGMNITWETKCDFLKNNYCAISDINILKDTELYAIQLFDSCKHTQFSLMNEDFAKMINTNW